MAASRPRASSPRRHRPASEWYLVGLGALLAVAGATLMLARPGPGPLQTADTVWIAVAIAVVFAAAESSLVHVEVRHQTFTVSLSELPLLLGLFLLPPIWVLATRLAAASVVFLFRRTARVKVVFNLGLFVAEVGAAELMFQALSVGNGLAPRDWLIAYLTTLVVDGIGSVAVVAAIGLLQGRVGISELGWTIPVLAVTGALNTTLALLALLVFQVNPAAIVLLVVLLVVIAMAYRAYRRLLRQHADLGQLFAFTQTVGAAQTSDGMIAELLRQSRVLLLAETALLRLAPQGAPEDRPAWPPAPGLPPEPLVIPSSTRDPVLRAWLRQANLRDALLVPLHDNGRVIGMLQVGNRTGVGTFNSDDLQLLQTVTAHAEVIRNNAHLLEQLRYDAQHDGLTGLANRSLFLSRLQDRLASCADSTSTEGLLADNADPAGVEAAVLLLDLDRFKEVNDTLGHHIGDLLLCQVADRLKKALPPGEVVARLGGDEFAVLLERCSGVGEASAIAVATRRALADPFHVAGTSLEVGASVGIAVMPTDGRQSATVLQHADVAMYSAKRSPSGVARYQRNDDQSSLNRLALAGELRRAIAAGELHVHYQPQVDMASGAIVRYEALVRWHHPRRGLLAPEEFIPIAEQTGLIGALTREVLRQALGACQHWQHQQPGAAVAVNLSARALLEADLPGSVRHLLAEAGIAPRLLTMEITESSVIGDFDPALAALQELNALGVRLSVDDFGTGYSSLSYLQRLPVREVKIDKSFVIPMRVSTNDAAIVRVIVDLAHTLGLTVVAEGVEDAETWDALAALGCDTAQGFLLSPPMPADQVAGWRNSRPQLPSSVSSASMLVTSSTAPRAR
ncbi:MAG: bifunctional diguanylate cyclase/phosphodiesterase [Actinomycetota bacterium]|nr:bifunctional diguanylate cyclase/phosphodiesterase [Actinomycetota bacterium]